MMPEIITRKEAFERGLKFFFTGKECRNTHIAQRYTTTYNCVECQRAYWPEYLRKYRRNLKIKIHGDDIDEWLTITQCQRILAPEGLCGTSSYHHTLLRHADIPTQHKGGKRSFVRVSDVREWLIQYQAMPKRPAAKPKPSPKPKKLKPPPKPHDEKEWLTITQCQRILAPEGLCTMRSNYNTLLQRADIPKQHQANRTYVRVSDAREWLIQFKATPKHRIAPPKQEQQVIDDIEEEPLYGFGTFRSKLFGPDAPKRWQRPDLKFPD